MGARKVVAVVVVVVVLVILGEARWSGYKTHRRIGLTDYRTPHYTTPFSDMAPRQSMILHPGSWTNLRGRLSKNNQRISPNNMKSDQIFDSAWPSHIEKVQLRPQNDPNNKLSKVLHWKHPERKLPDVRYFGQYPERRPPETRLPERPHARDTTLATEFSEGRSPERSFVSSQRGVDRHRHLDDRFKKSQRRENIRSYMPRSLRHKSQDQERWPSQSLRGKRSHQARVSGLQHRIGRSSKPTSQESHRPERMSQVAQPLVTHSGRSIEDPTMMHRRESELRSAKYLNLNSSKLTRRRVALVNDQHPEGRLYNPPSETNYSQVPPPEEYPTRRQPTLPRPIDERDGESNNRYPEPQRVSPGDYINKEPVFDEGRVGTEITDDLGWGDKVGSNVKYTVSRDDGDGVGRLGGLMVPEYTYGQPSSAPVVHPTGTSAITPQIEVFPNKQDVPKASHYGLHQGGYGQDSLGPSQALQNVTQPGTSSNMAYDPQNSADQDYLKSVPSKGENGYSHEIPSYNQHVGSAAEINSTSSNLTGSGGTDFYPARQSDIGGKEIRGSPNKTLGNISEENDNLPDEGKMDVKAQNDVKLKTGSNDSLSMMINDSVSTLHTSQDKNSNATESDIVTLVKGTEDAGEDKPSDTISGDNGDKDTVSDDAAPTDSKVSFGGVDESNSYREDNPGTTNTEEVLVINEGDVPSIINTTNNDGSRETMDSGVDDNVEPQPSPLGASGSIEGKTPSETESNESESADAGSSNNTDAGVDGNKEIQVPHHVEHKLHVNGDSQEFYDVIDPPSHDGDSAPGSHEYKDNKEKHTSTFGHSGDRAHAGDGVNHSLGDENNESGEVESKISQGSESAVSRGYESAVSRADESGISIGDDSVVPKGDESPVSRGDESAVSRGDESVVSRDGDSVVSRDDKSEVSRGGESAVSRDDESAVSRGGEPAVSRDDESVTSRDDKSAVFRGGESAVSRDDKSAVSTDDKSAVSRDDKSAVSRGGESAVSRDDKSAVSRDDKSAVSRDDKSAVSRGGESAVSRDDKSAVSRGGESAVSGDDESAVSRDDKSAVSRGGESAVSRDDKSAVSRGGESAVSRDDKSAVSRDDKSAVSRGGESAVSGDDISAVSRSGASAVSRGGESAVSRGGESAVPGNEESDISLEGRSRVTVKAGEEVSGLEDPKAFGNDSTETSVLGERSGRSVYNLSTLATKDNDDGGSRGKYTERARMMKVNMENEDNYSEDVDDDGDSEDHDEGDDDGLKGNVDVVDDGDGDDNDDSDNDDTVDGDKVEGGGVDDDGDDDDGDDKDDGDKVVNVNDDTDDDDDDNDDEDGGDDDNDDDDDGDKADNSDDGVDDVDDDAIDKNNSHHASEDKIAVTKDIEKPIDEESTEEDLDVDAEKDVDTLRNSRSLL